MKRSDWDTIAEEKTGALFRLIFEGVFLLCGLDTDQYSQDIGLAGRYLGQIYQMRDDLIDALGKKEGRAKGSDILEGKMTCLTVQLLEKNPELSGTLNQMLINPEELSDQVRIGTLTALYQSTGLIKDLYLQYQENGKSFLKLNLFKDHPALRHFFTALLEKIKLPELSV
jgi:geranylgeranyl pyrophosphate synthase